MPGVFACIMDFSTTKEKVNNKNYYKNKIKPSIIMEETTAIF